MESEPAAVWAPIESIHPWDDNPRHNDDAVASVARSISEFGFASPIVARKANREIIAGHTRYWAARQLGLESVPVRFLDVNSEQARTLALADNKLGEIATWDDDKLRALLSESTPDAAHIAGWSDGELTALLDDHQINVEPFTNSDDSTSNAEQPEITPGDDESDIPDDPDIANDHPHAQAPFPWYGGKSRAANAVWRHIGEVQHYIEPFCGSAAVLIRRPEDQIKPGNRETVNDADGLICNFWRALVADPEAVAHHANWPKSEADKHARHIALVRWKRDLPVDRLSANPDHYDPKIAGWWVWGQCLAFQRWCTGNDPWTETNGLLVKKENVADIGVLRNASLNDSGLLRKSEKHAPNDNPLAPTKQIIEWLTWIAKRLRNVAILHGDWTRPLAKTFNSPDDNTTGIFLDPPYSGGVRDQVYSSDDYNVAVAVREWCAKHGSHQNSRIILAGYSNEGHETLVTNHGWRERKWHKGKIDRKKSMKGSQGHRERLWLSPNCLP